MQGGAAQAVLGVVGAPAHVIARAIEVNEAKAALKKCCGPLQQRRMSAVVKDADGRDVVKPMSVIRLMLRDVGRPRLNLLGWSWGCALMSITTVQNPGKVARLMLHAPSWIRTP